MTYSETLDYLYANLPMFQRVGAVAYKEDLINTVQLCEALGNPHLKFKSVHIAGTNGKGSSSHMLAAILQTAGYKTGLYTSPHLKEFTERIRINGKEITQEFVINFVERITPAIERIQPSFFEITVAMAYEYFANEKVDIAVIETGLGGRLDSTNVITPLISLITNISWDHKDILGDTLQKIAFEKAGIIKQGVPVVISENQPEVREVFESKTQECKSNLLFASELYQVNRIADGTYEVMKDHQTFTYELDLLGLYQAKNIKGVLTVVDELRTQGFSISNDQVTRGLKNTTTLTGLKGRWQKLGENPLMICDTGHNEAGIKEILSQITEIRFNKLHWVLGMVKDKDVSTILHLLPKDANYYFCQASIPRAMPASELRVKAEQAGLQGVTINDVNAAIKEARKNSASSDLILIGGSTFVVAEIENL
ncbi:MAG TPA: folylpolyglutamate synthase/dihydrofolate synthase family protein [Cyclobacteriaceae bacterium]|nr:folylpolyglutamate synthase/dihydrofolate synthase family protein [Cyclobacteriaceae bacterium]HPW63065.1 folylpolyglutamate synthase/dihydrofolate synthase family protein [Cyclobacteriaceae bacterium]